MWGDPCISTHKECCHHMVNISFAYEIHITSAWLQKLEIFLDFLEVVMGPTPVLSSEVFLFPLHSPLLSVLVG